MKLTAAAEAPRGQTKVHPLASYVFRARWGVLLSSPLLYVCLIPFVLLDGLASLYQAVCFPIYGIPKVRRAAYLQYERAKLPYLNAIERLNCYYCTYANGIVAFVGEIAARTEQHWCPIQHAHDPKAPHSRYDRFLQYGDEPAYRDRGEEVRRDFRDLQGSDCSDARHPGTSPR